jgi:hypothetical protein
MVGGSQATFGAHQILTSQSAPPSGFAGGSDVGSPDLGEHTLAFYVAHGRGRQSGVEVVGQYANGIRWRAGLAVYIKAYTSGS